MKLTFDEAKTRFIKHGECSHDEQFHQTIEPLNCGVKITECGVCGQRISQVYLQ